MITNFNRARLHELAMATRMGANRIPLNVIQAKACAATVAKISRDEFINHEAKQFPNMGEMGEAAATQDFDDVVRFAKRLSP